MAIGAAGGGRSRSVKIDYGQASMSFRRKRARLVACVAWVLAPSAATAEQGTRTTLIYDAGARLPWGSTSDNGSALRELVAFEITMEAMLAFTVAAHFVVGPVMGGAWLWPGDSMLAICDAARAQGHETCSTDGFALRLGVRGEWHPLRGESFSPWLGVQSGYEFLFIGGRGDGAGFEEHLNGFELLGVRVGADVAAGPQLRLGAFAAWGTGTFMSRSAKCARNCGDLSPELGSIGFPALHHSLALGVRLEIDPRKPTPQ